MKGLTHRAEQTLDEFAAARELAQAIEVARDEAEVRRLTPCPTGTAVRYSRLVPRMDELPTDGEGLFEAAWSDFGVVGFDVRLSDGRVVILHPEYGDTMHPVEAK